MDIVLLGSGHVATHLGLALVDVGHRVFQVYSRTLENASKLAVRLSADPITDMQALRTDADVYVITVKDDAIEDVAAVLPPGLKGLVVHTAGSVGSEVLAPHVDRFGVLYPVQTFSKAKPVDFSVIPLALEASNEAAYAQLETLAQGLSTRVFRCDSRQRLALHVAAVFACNFTNHFYRISADILQHHGLDFDLIRPLVSETAEKVMTHQPRDVQTGPAVRNDRGTIAKHLALLQDQPHLTALYARISELIAP